MLGFWHGVAGGRGEIFSGLPVLAGPDGMFIFPGGNPPFFRRGRWWVAESPHQIVGGVAYDASHGRMEDAIFDVYREMFSAAEGWHLHRIWNFVPEINSATEGLENYRAFCVGRHRAFRERCGDAAGNFMPAASAVGTERPDFVAWFVGGRQPGKNIENPLQVPAYEYPAIHSPQPPAFSRATLVSSGNTPRLFISGTSSIRGHETVEPGNVRAQVGVTLENLREVLTVAGVELEKARSSSATVYLRNATDLAFVEAALRRDGIFHRTEVTFLRADICRAELDIEIECEVRL